MEGNKKHRRKTRDANFWRRAAASIFGAALLSAIALALCSPAGCGRGCAPANRPPVILISIDTLRADHLSCYGYFRETSPGIDAFRRDAVMFSQARTPLAHTLPAHVSMFSARRPLKHGLRNNLWRLRPDVPLLTESLKSAGYSTGAVPGAGVLKFGGGIERGFDDYIQGYDQSMTIWRRKRKVERKPASLVVDQGIAWIEKNRNEPALFLFMHFFDAHTPYDFLPVEYRASFVLDEEYRARARELGQEEEYLERANIYDGAIRYLDKELARFFEYLRGAGLYDDALIIVTADHGECLGQHGWYGHGLYVYEELMNVPLLIKLPRRVYGGYERDRDVGLIDIAPTILDYLDLPDLPGSEGVSLLPMIERPHIRARERVYYERRHYPERIQRAFEGMAAREIWGIKVGQWKYIMNDTKPDELYDLGEDPHELRNLARERRSVAAGLEKILEEHVSSGGGHDIVAPPISEKERKRLEALGYVE